MINWLHLWWPSTLNQPLLFFWHGSACEISGWNHISDYHTVLKTYHYNDVIKSAMASRITSLTSVYSTVYSGADQRKHQSSASLAFVRGIHRRPVNSQQKWPVTRQIFPFDDVIMIMWRDVLAISTSTLCGRPFWNNEDAPSSVSVERHRFLKSYAITRHVSFHWHIKCHYQKLWHMVVIITCRRGVGIGRMVISGLNHTL